MRCKLHKTTNILYFLVSYPVQYIHVNLEGTR